MATERHPFELDRLPRLWVVMEFAEILRDVLREIPTEPAPVHV
jgi:hypothetical protein